MPNAYISGTGAYFPPRIVKNDDFVTDFGVDTSDEWITKRTGIKERRFVEPGVTCSDLAVPASEQALEAAGLDKTDLDMIIFATLSPDIGFPGSGVFLQRKLGLCDAGHFIPAMDVRTQCTGFIYSLTTAASFVRSGGAKHILVVGAETHSVGMDISTRGRAVCTLFGDGAGAAIVSPTDEDKGIRNWTLGADGRHTDKLYQAVWDMRRRPYIPQDENGVGQVPPEMLWPQMNGRHVFKHAVERMITCLMQSCWDQKIDINDIDLFFFHQANMRINQYVSQQLNIPDEKMFHNIHKYGNTTAATIPTLLDEAIRTDRLKSGMKVAMVAFGSGFTWGSIIADW
ncbi:MAG: ketoacyl-ACP synthase III [Proteobacteria bacterium]|nr:ketoacyl-ACP synthase III [Pseudomonadota bacterium]